MYRYMKTETLATNQNMSCMRSRTPGSKSTSPTNPSSPANIPSPAVWIRICGIFGIRTVPSRHSPARTKSDNAGTNENAKSHAVPLSKLGNGRIQPPSQSVTAMDETASIAAYSARKNSDQRNPLYSVWKPATSSDSASGRSNGARLVSATIAMAKIANARNPSGKNLKMNQTCCCCCASTMPIILSVPVPVCRLVISTAQTIARPMATSYETICALERSEPIRGYCEFDDQPAMMMPSTPSDETPSMNRMPMFISVTACVGPNGTTRNVVNAVIVTTTGALQKTSLSALAGMMSSLMSSFSASANGCSSPCGPTRMGPRRICMCARILRSSQFMAMTDSETPMVMSRM